MDIFAFRLRGLSLAALTLTVTLFIDEDQYDLWLCCFIISTVDGMIVTSALIIWKALMCITGSESPVVVVLSGSMEPGFKRGDILFLHMSKDPIRAGEIVVFNVDGREIPIVHRVIKVHEREDTGEVDVLTKGDNNYGDDRLLYAHGQLWLQRHHIMGRAVGFLPYVGWVTIIMTEKPIIKVCLLCQSIVFM
ncbi:hypothetical protein LR48_Vigan05g219300 [Vigna angularis]|uniref:Signal peptidase complex catalytic subunit SEC11 n=1 Tax=Phaseolus angularis TaxID=3914 RepID=A0A0L9UPD0_PHAAN|nr:hypothetical protein LR48_Vigan05g219300 [Vigna angularis]